jgi:hypothetical protein
MSGVMARIWNRLAVLSPYLSIYHWELSFWGMIVPIIEVVERKKRVNRASLTEAKKSQMGLLFFIGAYLFVCF